MAATCGESDEESKAPSVFVDCHVHWWDTKVYPNPNLVRRAGTWRIITHCKPHHAMLTWQGDIVATIPSYSASDYRADLSTATRYRVAGAVHVEAVVGQQDGGYELDPLAETEFVCKLATSTEAPPDVVIVPYVHLGRSNCSEMLHKQVRSTCVLLKNIG